ncbi:MAG: N-acetyltransferase [Oscillospiraceae bacterium]|nr:N-acetyltransferase [Oscillospiraceae bacterium]
MKIRQERETDRAAVYEVIKAAFASAEHSDGNEQDLVTALRNSGAFVPDLSLVAEEDGNVVGHILFTKADVDGHTVLALAPLSVLPLYQQQGIGLALMAEGHRIAKELGFDYSVVLGHAEYYPKAGYCPASRFGIKAPFDVADENYMAVKLNPDAKELHGVMRYYAAFGL